MRGHVVDFEGCTNLVYRSEKGLLLLPILRVSRFWEMVYEGNLNDRDSFTCHENHSMSHKMSDKKNHFMIIPSVSCFYSMAENGNWKQCVGDYDFHFLIFQGFEWNENAIMLAFCFLLLPDFVRFSRSSIAQRWLNLLPYFFNQKFCNQRSFAFAEQKSKKILCGIFAKKCWFLN